MPVRSDNNQQYIKELDRIVLKTMTKSREFGNTATVRKTAIMTRVLQFVHQAVRPPPPLSLSLFLSWCGEGGREGVKEREGA